MSYRPPGTVRWTYPSAKLAWYARPVPRSQATWPLTTTTELVDAGTAIVPLVPAGVVARIANSSREDSQLTEMSPYRVGTEPWAQARFPGCGLMLQVAYPGSTGVTPRTCSVSCTVGDAAQPWARLAVVRLTPPVLFLNSHSAPV